MECLRPWTQRGPECAAALHPTWPWSKCGPAPNVALVELRPCSKCGPGPWTHEGPHSMSDAHACCEATSSPANESCKPCVEALVTSLETIQSCVKALATSLNTVSACVEVSLQAVLGICLIAWAEDNAGFLLQYVFSALVLPYFSGSLSCAFSLLCSGHTTRDIKTT